MVINNKEGQIVNPEYIVVLPEMQQVLDSGFEGYAEFSDQGKIQFRIYLSLGNESVIFQKIKVSTGSYLRKKFLLYLNNASGSNLDISFQAPTGEENQFSNPDEIALQKNLNIKSDDVWCLGIDSQTNIPCCGPLAKPRNFEEIRENLLALGQQARYSGSDWYYFVNSAAVLSNDKRSFVSRRGMVVGLHPSVIEVLSTPSGFGEYLAVADKYQDHAFDLEYASSLLKIGGGLALPVLIRLGAISTINGKSLSDPTIDRILYSAFRTALVGGGNRVFQMIFGTSTPELADNWDYLTARVRGILR